MPIIEKPIGRIWISLGNLQEISAPPDRTRAFEFYGRLTPELIADLRTQRYTALRCNASDLIVYALPEFVLFFRKHVRADWTLQHGAEFASVLSKGNLEIPQDDRTLPAVRQAFEDAVLATSAYRYPALGTIFDWKIPVLRPYFVVEYRHTPHEPVNRRTDNVFEIRCMEISKLTELQTTQPLTEPDARSELAKRFANHILENGTWLRKMIVVMHTQVA